LPADGTPVTLRARAWDGKVAEYKIALPEWAFEGYIIPITFPFPNDRISSVPRVMGVYAIYRSERYMEKKRVIDVRLLQLRGDNLTLFSAWQYTDIEDDAYEEFLRALKAKAEQLPQQLSTVIKLR
jgi:hypothetical protein